jgi:DNA-binding transcriptional ArsR family regulator
VRWVGNSVESLRAFRERLAIVLSDPLRLKIVTELFMRAMSPKEFFEEFGGGSVSRVARHFETLEEYRWLRCVGKKGPGGRRFGAVESFYRARELVILDGEAWETLPYLIRAEFSSTTFTQFTERVVEAMQAGTFDARADRHFTRTTILLDQTGWERITAALNDLFKLLYEEQDDAKIRAQDSGEERFLLTVALGGFESPKWDREEDERRVALTSAEYVSCPVPFHRASKVLDDPLCLKILDELSVRPMSAIGFYRKFGGTSQAGIYRRFKKLAKLGFLEEVRRESGGKRRGARERFLRATAPAIFDGDSWTDLPDPVKSTPSWRIFRQLAEQFQEAMEAGTLDARPDRHLTWSLLLLDQEGWEKVMDALNRLFECLREEQAAAEKRVAESGEQRIQVTVALAGFESPKNSTKAP